MVLGRELPVRLRGIGAGADDLGAHLLERLVVVAEGARLLRAAGRGVIRVEVENDRLLAAIVTEPHATTIAIGKREVRRRVTRPDRRGSGEDADPAAATEPY